MLRGILAFELRYQMRRLGFAAVAAGFALFGFATAATEFGPKDLALNSPYSIAQSIGFASLFAVLGATLFCAQGALRDPEHGMTEIVFSTPISRSQYLFGRFAGAVLALAAASAFLVPGLIAGTFAVAHDPARVAPFDPLPYLAAYAVLVLPSIVLVCAILFAVALASRSVVATHVAAVLTFAAYFVVALFSGSPIMASSSPPTERGLAIAALADPFGLSAFFAGTRYWTAAERETRLLPLEALAGNRLLWLALTLVLLAAIHRAFRFRLPGGGRPSMIAAHHSVSHWRPVAPTGGTWAGFTSAVRREVGHALRSWATPALLLGWVAVLAIELSQTFGHFEFGTALTPTTALVMGEMTEPLALFGLIAVVYYAAELVWRERSAGMAEIIDATPVASGALYAAKVTALAALIGLLLLVAVLAAMAFQLIHGASPEPAPYLALAPLVGLPLVLVAVLAVLVQVLVGNRHAGVLVTAVVALFWHRGVLGGPAHPLLRYAGLPDAPYSAMAGFAPEGASFVWLAAYWSAFALLLAAVGTALWRRGVDTRLRARFFASRATRRVAAAAALACLLVGAVIFHEVHVAHAYQSDDDVEAWRAAYERRYRHVEAVPQPTPSALALALDLHPADRRFEARGRYTLVNRGPAPIDSIWVTVRRDLARVSLRLDGRAPTEVDAAFATHRFAVHLPAGGRAELAFDLAVDRRGFAAGPAERDIVGNGSFLMGHTFLPSIGYRRSAELEDPGARRRHGLPLAPRVTTGDVETATGPIALDVTITTAPDQIALAPGRLVERAAGRFRYRTDQPVSPIIAVASGRYTVARREHEGVTIELHHHPGHGANVPAMLEAAARTLALGTRAYGPYPHDVLRIVEVPATSPLARRGTAFAVPTVVFVPERSGFLTDRSDLTRVDVVTKRIAHEVAHQWWGHQVSPVPRPGASTLVETLARDTELRVLADVHGARAVAPVLAFELDRYLAGRGGPEPPLARVVDEGFVSYAKGALVMAAIRDLLGDAATDRALASLVASARAGDQPEAADLLAVLQREAPPGHRALLAEWWNGVVLYDLRVLAARARPLPDGRLALEVTLGATRTDAGRALPLDEELDLAVYPDDPGTSGGGEPLETLRVRVRGDQRVTLEVGAAARYVLVDPRILRIDRNRADNLRVIERAD